MTVEWLEPHLPALARLGVGVGWALLHSVWQGAAAALALAAALPLLRGPERRHAATLSALAALPIAFFVTAWRALPPAPPAGALLPLPEALAALAALAAVDGSAALEPLLPALALLWLAGAAFEGLRWVGGALLLARLRARAEPLGGDLQRRLDALRARLGVRRAVTLLRSARVRTPTVIGWLRPALLLPASALSGLTPAQIDAVLTHELAHVRRHDALGVRLAAVVRTLFWYHPAARWLGARLAEEREASCDAAAVAVVGDPLGYARALALLAERAGSAPAPLALAATGGPLMIRIRRLLEPAPRHPRAALAPLLALTLLLAACGANPFAGRAATATLTNWQSACLGAHVTTGSHAIPAFDAASVRAMRARLGAAAVEPAASCGRSDVRLDYRMAFDARALRWNAELRATDAAGTVLWSGRESAAIPSDGAFQYLSESNAETLLARFLASAERPGD